MKHKTVILSVVAVAVLLEAPAFAVPTTMSFSGQLVDQSGAVSGDVSVRFAIYASAENGASLWEENQVVAAESGVVSAMIGSADPVGNPLTADLFTGESRYLEISVNGETQHPRLAFTSVPYALRAEASAHASHADSCTTADGISGPLALSDELSFPDGTVQRTAFGKSMTIRSERVAAMPLANGESECVTAMCEADELATGGGCADSGRKEFYQFRPVTDGYMCCWYNTSGADHDVVNATAYANCLK